MSTMVKFFKFSAWSLLLLLMISLVVGGLLTGLAQEGLANSGHWHVVVDGEPIADAEMAEMMFSGAGVFGTLIGITVTVFCLLLVLPLVLLLGVGLPLLCVMLALGGVAFALLGVAALVAAPLLVPLLLLIWLLRRKRVPQAA